MAGQFISAVVEAKRDEVAIRQQVLRNRINSYIYGNIRGQKPLLEEQQEVLKDYFKYLITENEKATSYYSYLNSIVNVSLFGRYIQKPFNQVTKDELKQFFFDLHNQKRKESTINEYKVKLKMFFKFLYGTKGYPEIVEWVKVSKVKQKKLAEDELLSKTDTKRMVNVADNSRDKAIPLVLRESAGREHEFVSLKIKNVIEDKYGIKLKLCESKTYERVVRLIDSVPYLLEWLNNHPFKDDPEAPLWISFSKKSYGWQLSENGLKRIVKKLTKRAKITKRVYVHLFRHSRLNELGNMGFNERDLQIIGGWSEQSPMPKTYLHYGEKEVDRKLLEKEGRLQPEEEQEQIKDKETLKPIKCPRCKMINGATSKYCSTCSMALDLKTVMMDQVKVEDETNKTIQVLMQIMKDPKKLKQFEEFKKKQTFKAR